MHAQLETPSGFTLMASDAPPGMPLDKGATVSISLSGDDSDELRRFWEGLSEGAQVTMPLEKQMWGDEFGMLTDRFGMQWMVNIAGVRRVSSRPQKTSGSTNSIDIDHVTWVRIGATIPPVDRRWRPVMNPRTAAEKASMRLPVSAVATA